MWQRVLTLGDGQTIAVRGTGPRKAGAPTLVCVHGLPGRGCDFDPLLRALPATLSALAMDRAGYGDSAPFVAGGGTGERAEARRLLDLLELLELRQVILLGWSYGGGIVGAASRMAPERIRAVVLLGAAGPALRFPRGLVDRLLFRSPFGEGLLRAAARLGRLALGPAFNDAYGETAPAAVLDRFVADARRAGHRRRWIDEGQRLVPERIELPPPDCPTLLLHGTADASVPIEVARASAAEREDLHLVEVAGAGHWPFATHTQETVDALVAFFRSLDDR